MAVARESGMNREWREKVIEEMRKLEEGKLARLMVGVESKSLSVDEVENDYRTLMYFANK